MALFCSNVLAGHMRSRVLVALPRAFANCWYCVVSSNLFCRFIIPSLRPSHVAYKGFLLELDMTSDYFGYHYVDLCGYHNYNLGFGLDSAFARSRNCLRKIFPAGLFGTWSMMTTPPLRNLCLATRPWTHSCIPLENAAVSAPGRGFTLGTIYALRERGLGHPTGGSSTSIMREDEPR